MENQRYNASGIIKIISFYIKPFLYGLDGIILSSVIIISDTSGHGQLDRYDTFFYDGID
jgi:hypothetical protein